MMRPKAKTMLEEKQEEIEEIVEEHPIYYGEAETVETKDWEERFRIHQEVTKEMESETEERIEKKEKQERVGNY